MAVKIKKILKKNPLQPGSAKWYLTQEKTGTVGLKEIAQEISGRSSLSLGDVLSALSNLVEILPLFLKLGQTIRLDGFGSLHLSVASEGTEQAEELSVRHVKGTRLIFRPNPAMKRSLGDISFEIV
jgi:predicted histone-like DNA-binding protein